MLKGSQISAATRAIMQVELGPSDDEDHMLTLYDLVPEEWIGGTETREDVTERLANALAYAALASSSSQDTPTEGK